MRACSSEEISSVVSRFWGFDGLRPLQEEAIRAELEGRDSLVVLPTGGGKSLCYQVPPVLLPRLDVVVSPLISLMKDQVDGLKACGYPAVCLHSGMQAPQTRRALAAIDSGECRLLFVAPERLLSPNFLEYLKRKRIGAFAIDEAHCISHWGHDFRPEYRRLSALKDHFPSAAVHAYTATATSRVRDDIERQLRLADPITLVGTFDRPNLTYRVVARQDVRPQVLRVLNRHRGEAAIIYCISRAETERLALHLADKGFRAAHYHAGMPSQQRRTTQDQFSNEEIDIVVATVAFGMGIDRSNVRCVIHTAMPKSVEHYQQETGRAGRDGLEAECILFHSPADVLRWQSLIAKNAQNEPEDGNQPASAVLLAHMRKYCSPNQCRHRFLSEYFGQHLQSDNCGACDICLGETDNLLDGTLEAQKILSCVARVGQRFGVGYVADVLRGAETSSIRANAHNRLSTYGLLDSVPKTELVNHIHQLVEQDLVERRGEDYPVLRLNHNSAKVLRGERRVWLIPFRSRKIRGRRRGGGELTGVDQELFQALRTLRTEVARERGVPPYLIFSDATLRDMARKRPATPSDLISVHGVGEKKLTDPGPLFLREIKSHLARRTDSGQ